MIVPIIDDNLILIRECVDDQIMISVPKQLIPENARKPQTMN